MSFRKRLVIFLLALLVLAGLDALCAPFVVAHGVRYWIVWAAKKHHFSAAVGEIEAPFLGEVTIRNLRLTSTDAMTNVELHVSRLVVDLNLRGWLLTKRAHVLRSVEAANLTGKINVSPQTASTRKLDWKLLSQLLPDNVRCDHVDFDVTAATTTIHFRNVALTASAIESGKFLAREISVNSPLLRQTFSNLRGATSWEAGRLTIAGIPLVPRLDLEALTIDFSHLARRRLGIDLHLDSYGGTLRASFQGRAGEKFGIDIAGSAANVSLTQFCLALGFREPITGAVRASKFTFRGNPGEFLDGTASLWIELTNFAWRARRADNVMLGATYYNRRLEVDQLYVRQRQNELTVNGELAWPKGPGGWTRPPFRGQLNAAIPDLNGFAQFLGATTGDFSGAIFAEGNLDSVSPEAHGKVTLRGEAVNYRGVALDSLGASLLLKGTEMTVEKMEVLHAQDFMRAEGSFDLAASHRFAGRLTGAIDDLGAYAALLPEGFRSAKIGGGVTFDWTGDGTLAAHSGTMQLFAHGLQLPVAPLRLPLDLTLEGTYSPQDIFFRTFKLASQRVSLGGFLLLGQNFTELQALTVNLDGVPRISGTLFLPFSFARWRATRSLLEALDEGQKFDVDLAVDGLDLKQFASALGEQSTATGILYGKVAAFGPLRSLQLTLDAQLQNLGPSTESNSINCRTHYADGRADLDLNAIFGVSAPLAAKAWLPLRLDKSSLAAGNVLDPAEQLFLKIDCPALFLETLPNDWRWKAEHGLVTGGISFSNTVQAPMVNGTVQILNAQFLPQPPWPQLRDLEAEIYFANSEVFINPLRFRVDSNTLSLRGRFTANTSTFSLTLMPLEPIIALPDLPQSGTTLARVRVLDGGIDVGEQHLREIFLRGGISSGPGSLTISSESEQFVPSQTTYFLSTQDGSSSSLLLRPVLPERSPVFPSEPIKVKSFF
jgi:hypothetical protein